MSYFALNFLVALVVFALGFITGKVAAELLPAILGEREHTDD